MSNAPFFKLFFSDLAGDTLHLSDAEFGSYVLLLGAMWNAGGALPNDPPRLCRMARCAPGKWASRWAILKAFFADEGDFLTNGRLQKERKKVDEISQERREVGRRGNEAKSRKRLERGDANANANGLANDTQPEPEGSKMLPTEANLTSCKPTAASDPKGSPLPAWPGPADIREMCVASQGEDFTRSWLDPCGWQDVPEPMILTRGQMDADRLWRVLRQELIDRGISIGRKAA